MKKKVPIVTEAGEGILEEMWISELNYLMVKVYFPKEGRWISYNLGEHKLGEDILSASIKKMH